MFSSCGTGQGEQQVSFNTPLNDLRNFVFDLVVNYRYEVILLFIGRWIILKRPVAHSDPFDPKGLLHFLAPF